MQATEKQKQIFLCKIKYSNFLSNHFKQNDESLKVSLFYSTTLLYFCLRKVYLELTDQHVL